VRELRRAVEQRHIRAVQQLSEELADAVPLEGERRDVADGRSYRAILARQLAYVGGRNKMGRTKDRGVRR
jgi:hypothetical protein